jgi:copper resistance protein C
MRTDARGASGGRRAGATRILAAAIVWLGLVPGAEAHAVLVRSSPANRAVITQAPARMQLWFNERIEPAYARLTVVDARAEAVDTGAVIVDPDDPRQLSVALRPLGAGRYTARYRVLSVDGHVVEGEVSFKVRKRS